MLIRWNPLVCVCVFFCVSYVALNMCDTPDVKRLSKLLYVSCTEAV